VFSRRTIKRSLTVFTPRKHLLIACFPKSGSTYLRELLSEVTGFRTIFPVVAEGPGVQDIFELRLRENRHHCVMQMHVVAHRNNVEIMQAWQMKPIVLVRNIFDVVPSIADHFARESRVSPLAFVHDEYSAMSTEQRHDYIISAFLPWYFSFLFSWRAARKKLDTFWLSYEQLFADPAGQVKRILDFQGVEADDTRIAKALGLMNSRNTRKNIGVSGRGLKLLTPAQVAAIRGLAEAWRVDCEELRMIGISSGDKPQRAGAPHP
jgi:hypothetical protein